VAGSTSKKVVIYRFDRPPLPGFVNPSHYLLEQGVELISPQGALTVVPYQEVKAVCFVRDFEGPELPSERRLFASRPKSEGLWLRMRLRDGEFQDGLLPNDLLALNAAGFLVLPPDATANTQRMFIPKAALTDLKVLGVVGTPLRRRQQPPAEEQITLFE